MSILYPSLATFFRLEVDLCEQVARHRSTSSLKKVGSVLFYKTQLLTFYSFFIVVYIGTITLSFSKITL
jgi:hypothetical protein